MKMDGGDFIWNVVQQCQINKLNKTFGAAKDVVAQDQAGMQSAVGQVEERLDHLALICRAMFEILKEKGGVSDQDLVRKIAEVDLRDGQADGKMTAKAKPCPSCGSMMSPRFNRCLFCGHHDEAGDPFNAV